MADALEHLEQFAAHGGLLMAPEDMEALKSILSELRAAREAVEPTGLRDPNDHNCYGSGFEDALDDVRQKMKDAQ